MVDVTEQEIRATVQGLQERQHAYQIVFSEGAAASVVLADLAKFCRAEMPTFHADPRQHARLEGRREVWLRVKQHLEKSLEDLLDLYAGDKIRVVRPQEEDPNAV